MVKTMAYAAAVSTPEVFKVLFNMVVNVLIDFFDKIKMEFATYIGVDVLADANGNTALDFAVPKPSREFSR